jgi:enamine deaminase RidA (YjgF/YER057c/UK114 family)
MRQNVSSNSPFEPIIGFSRAVRVDNVIFVSGTVGWRADGTLPDGPYEQLRQAIANVEAALRQAGALLSDVVRTRIYVTDMAMSEDVARAHREAFGDIRPAATLVEISRLAAPQMLVEIEADAVATN